MANYTTVDCLIFFDSDVMTLSCSETLVTVSIDELKCKTSEKTREMTTNWKKSFKNLNCDSNLGNFVIDTNRGDCRTCNSLEILLLCNSKYCSLAKNTAD